MIKEQFQFVEKMNDLAMRVGREIEGENPADVAAALSGVLALAITQVTPSLEERRLFLDKLVEAMNAEISSTPGTRKPIQSN
jgi:hypothetical protein